MLKPLLLAALVALPAPAAAGVRPGGLDCRAEAPLADNLLIGRWLSALLELEAGSGIVTSPTIAALAYRCMVVLREQVAAADRAAIAAFNAQWSTRE